ncbi:hypothetical protein F5Y07DRAFT_352287 [Xylaria sp. FL0933]|nr:hypothetical protein F5Y07DRAFT_352287 [Xylaria sp. FL0933]
MHFISHQLHVKPQFRLTAPAPPVQYLPQTGLIGTVDLPPSLPAFFVLHLLWLWLAQLNKPANLAIPSLLSWVVCSLLTDSISPFFFSPFPFPRSLSSKSAYTAALSCVPLSTTVLIIFCLASVITIASPRLSCPSS